MQRLSPIYTAIDDEKYELAIKICDKALKKDSREFQTIKALKSLALVRSGMYQAAYDVAFEVKSTNPTDAPTLQAVFMTFKMLHMYDDIIDLYRVAYSLAPRNEEWANHWFMALARKGDWKKLQQAAMKLTKEFKKDKYYLWMTMAVYLQALDPNAKNQTILYSLAEKMMAKALSDDKIKDFEALQMYILILHSCEKYKDALGLLEGPLKTLCKVEIERKKLCLESLVKVEGSGSVIMEYCRDILLINPDDWFCYKLYLEFALKDPRESFEDKFSFFRDLQKLKIRGPYLAELYFCGYTSQTDRLPELLTTYLAIFGYTLCCFDDIYPILKYLSEKQAADLMDSLDSEFFLDTTKSERLMIADTRKHINLMKLKQYLKLYRAENLDCRTEVDSILKHYPESLSLKVKDERERQYGDGYIELAAHAVLEQFAVTRDVALLYNAIIILEYGLQESKFNYLFKILLIRLYFEIGISERPLNLAESLDIKSVQFDSLSFLFTDGLEYFGQLKRSLRTLKNTLGIYDRNSIETPEMILQAFKFGTFSKIPEFIDFKMQLQFSIHRAITHRQLDRLEFLNCSSWVAFINRVKSIDLSVMSLDGHCPFLNFSALADNRDMSLVGRYSKSEKSVLTEIRPNFPLDGKGPANSWLKLHSLLPLAYIQLFGNQNEGYTASVSDITEFLDNSNMDYDESLSLRIVLIIMKKKELLNSEDEIGKLVPQMELLKVDDQVDGLVLELEELWNEVEALLEGHSLSFAICQKLTFLIEGWNAMIALIFWERKKSVKAIISKQLKYAKKNLSSLHSKLESETLKSLQSRLVSLPIASAAVISNTLEHVRRGWLVTLSGMISLVDGRLGMLHDVNL